MRQTTDPFPLIWMRDTGVSFLLITWFCWCGQPAPPILRPWFSAGKGSIMDVASVCCVKGAEMKGKALNLRSDHDLRSQAVGRERKNEITDTSSRVSSVDYLRRAQSRAAMPPHQEERCLGHLSRTPRRRLPGEVYWVTPPYLQREALRKTTEHAGLG